MAEKPDEADVDEADEPRHSDGPSTDASGDAAAGDERADADVPDDSDVDAAGDFSPDRDESDGSATDAADEPTESATESADETPDEEDADEADGGADEPVDEAGDAAGDAEDATDDAVDDAEDADEDGDDVEGAEDGDDAEADTGEDDGGDDLPTPDSLTSSALGHDEGEPSPNPSIDDRPEAQTDGEGFVGDRPPAGEPEPAYPDPDEDVGGISNPPDDEEMPLADHIEEMILRLAKVLLVGAAATAIGLLWASDAISIIWTDIFPGEDVPPPHVYNPLELWLTRIKIAALAGVLAALPWFVYETYLFMRPGLYPHERKYYLASVPMSVVLALLGMVFSYYLVLPVLFMYFTYYSEGSALIAYGLGDTFNLVITLMGFLAVVFQIPLFIMLAIMMGVTTRQWLAEKRLYFWAAFAGLAFMFTMDPTMMAAVLVAATMILLFEGTLFLLKWTGRE